MLYHPFANTTLPKFNPKCIERQLLGTALDLVIVTNAAARLKAIDILMSPHLQGIDFSIPGARVTSKMLTDVLSHIVKRNMQVDHWHAGHPDYRQDAMAQYDPNSDTLSIPLTNDRESLGAVVHESIHAAHDISHDTRMTVLATESAAYIGECVFLLNSQKADHRTKIFDKGSPVDNIYDAAWNIAWKVLGRGPLTESNVPPQTTFTDAELTGLYDAVRLVYTSAEVTAGMNGIKIVCGAL